MMKFLDLLFPPRADEAALRGVSALEFLEKMSPRIASDAVLPAAALFPFADPVVRAAIHEAKYHGSEAAFALLASALAEYLRESEDFGAVRLVPVPLSPARKKSRGFNQVEEVVRRAARELGMDADAALLTRTRDTASQVALPRGARLENMRGAFSATSPLSSSPTYIVVDDVITTGATLHAAALALREAGAVHILPLALAH